MIRENPTQEEVNSETKQRFIQFLQKYKNKNGELIYVNQAMNIIGQGKKKTLTISIKDFMFNSHQMCEIITQEYYKNEPYLNEALTTFMHDMERNKMVNQGNQNFRDDKNERYYVSFQHIHSQELRSLKCQSLGKLIAFRGTVTRTTEVRPQLITGVFKCTACQQLSAPVPQQFKYTLPKKCKTTNCDANKWQLQTSRCQFSDFQKIRVQQDPTSIPAGAMPRSVDVILRNQMTEKAQPGDICQFIGMLCVLPDISSMIRPGEKTQLITKNTQSKGNSIGMEGVTGLKQTGVRDLNYKLVFIANNVKVENNQFNQFNDGPEEQQQENQTYSDQQEVKRIKSKFTIQQQQCIMKMLGNENLYECLANSLFPAIYGNIEIKKAILLQLFSGIHKVTKSKINIRGDLNILIVGDPSTAKSQFLKSIQQFVPRSIYTSGKTTSAAGLTATVTRDENGDVGIEAGALMLADNGVCCIDEFDKMDIKDQVAIHEAMEQQTISLAKAGIYATLNARTSILAAANPLFGRYDKSKSLKHNIHLSDPIMSRFDLYFVICDQSDDLSDQNISNFIINMHKNKQKAVQVTYKKEQIRRYIQCARKFKPRLTKQSAELLRKYYKQLRNKDKVSQNNSSYRVTVRQLESMIRLSEAFARLHLSFEIKPEYVTEAYRLINTSILKIQKNEVELEADQGLQQGMRNLNLQEKRTRNLMEQQLKNRQNEKKTQAVTISYQIFQRMQKNILDLFKIKQQQFTQHSSQMDETFGLKQSDIVDYILGLNSDNIVSTQQLQHFSKLVNAVIKLLIERERFLVIIQDNEATGNRMLGIHPNFTE